MAKTYKVMVRLYRRHDLDLITFMELHQFDLSRAVYSTLKAFAAGDVFNIEIPERYSDDFAPRKIYARLITLHEGEDDDAIKIVNSIQKGYRNAFLKALLRLYLTCPLSEKFLIDENNFNDFQKKLHIFREGKKTVKAGKLPYAKKRRANASLKTNEEKKEEAAVNTKIPSAQPINNISKPAEYTAPTNTEEKPVSSFADEPLISNDETASDAFESIENDIEDAGDMFAAILGD